MEDTLTNDWTKFLSTMKQSESLNIYHMATADADAAAASSASSSVENQSSSSTMNSLVVPPHPDSHSNPHSLVQLLPRPSKCQELLISTKTKVLFLNQPINIEHMFWNIQVIDYWRQEIGALKKTIKLVSLTPEKCQENQAKLVFLQDHSEDIIRQVNITTGPRSPKYKDERKITVGISKKDIMACRGKKKNVFYNCFAMVMRVIYKGEFKEIHAKIFNTGKMEIPGVFNDELLDIAQKMVLTIMQPFIASQPPPPPPPPPPLPLSPSIPILSLETCSVQESIIEEKYSTINEQEPMIAEEDSIIIQPPPLHLEYLGDGLMNDESPNVLINSNFNCGFHIYREKLHNILKGPKYQLDSSYDPCTYPGVKCKFYFNHETGYDYEKQKGQIREEDWNLKMKNIVADKKYTEVSIMIFRTGSSLIGGNCSERVLRFIFEFITQLIWEEYKYICIPGKVPEIRTKIPKLRKKTIQVQQA